MKTVVMLALAGFGIWFIMKRMELAQIGTQIQSMPILNCDFANMTRDELIKNGCQGGVSRQPPPGPIPPIRVPPWRGGGVQ